MPLCHATNQPTCDTLSERASESTEEKKEGVMATESRPCPPSGHVRAQANTYDGARQMRKLPCNYSAQNHFQVFAGGGPRSSPGMEEDRNL